MRALEAVPGIRELARLSEGEEEFRVLETAAGGGDLKVMVRLIGEATSAFVAQDPPLTWRALLGGVAGAIATTSPSSFGMVAIGRRAAAAAFTADGAEANDSAACTALEAAIAQSRRREGRSRARRPFSARCCPRGAAGSFSRRCVVSNCSDAGRSGRWGRAQRIRGAPPWPRRVGR